MTQTPSILAQVRFKALREYQSQLSQVSSDEVADAYERGLYRGLKELRHVGRWCWCFGVLCGIALSALVWSFWP